MKTEFKTWEISRMAKVAHMIKVGHFSDIVPTPDYIENADDVDALIAAVNAMRDEEDSVDTHAEAVDAFNGFDAEDRAIIVADIDAELLQAWRLFDAESSVADLKWKAEVLRDELYQEKDAALQKLVPSEYHLIGGKYHPFYSDVSLHGQSCDLPEGATAVTGSALGIPLNSIDDSLVDEVIERLDTDVYLDREVIGSAYKSFQVWLSCQKMKAYEDSLPRNEWEYPPEDDWNDTQDLH